MQYQFFEFIEKIGAKRYLDLEFETAPFWLDAEFDQLVNQCFNDLTRFYYSVGNPINKIIRRIFNRSENFRNLSSSPRQSEAPFPDLSNWMLRDYLIFNTNRGVNINASVFQSWQNASRLGRTSSSGVINRVMGSFQPQFDYSVYTTFDSYIAYSNQVHWFNPIMEEMYNLPFVFSGLRPGFNNTRLFEFLERRGTLHKAAVYHMNVGKFSRFIFDRYLYDHARILLGLPFKYQLVPQSKYLVNFGSVISSSYFSYLPNKFQFSYFKNFNFFYVLSSFKLSNNADFLKNNVSPEILIRRSLIVQVMLNFWKLLIKLKPYFDTVSFTFYLGLPGADDSFREDETSRIFFGRFSDQSFDRITRRVFFALSKFLYSSPTSTLITLFIYSFYQKSNVLNLSGNWEVSTFDYVNMLVEFEKWYRGQDTGRFINKSIFETWFFDYLEQFYEYEVWLHVYLQSIFNFLDILFLLILAIRLLKFFRWNNNIIYIIYIYYI